MKIKISSHCKPFTHSYGASLVLPGSGLALRIYPQRIIVDDLLQSKFNILTLKNNLEGPVKGFTVQQDHERGCIDVWGNSISGYFGYRIRPLEDVSGVSIALLKNALEGFDWRGEGRVFHTRQQNKSLFTFDDSPSTAFQLSKNIEILHLGSHKKQDWDLVHRRCDMTEILPIWFSLGQRMPECTIDRHESLFSRCQEVIERRENDQIINHLRHVYQTGFSGLLYPQLEDSNYQGFRLPPLTASSPLALLSGGAALIRSLFIRQTTGEVYLLPALPPEFHCGRMLDVNTAGIGKFDIEWTKKTIRRIIIRPEFDVAFKLHLQNHVKTYLLRTHEKLHGITKSNGDEICLKGGITYLLDNFKK